MKMSVTEMPLNQQQPQLGWLAGASHYPSPFYTPRPNPKDIRLLVVHGISLPRNQFNTGLIHALFLGQAAPLEAAGLPELAELKVSAHFLIQRSGQLDQFVNVFDQAWHAGVSIYHGEEQCNRFSIGVELEGSDDQPYTAIQYQALADLVQDLEALLNQQGIYKPLEILGHQHIAPGRKTDPGPFFNWASLARLTNRTLTLKA
ncbi:AmpD protein [Thiomicrospira sp. ALE5]|nr:AmpD protein [Thiomicrospira sp. ALE5]